MTLLKLIIELFWILILWDFFIIIIKKNINKINEIIKCFCNLTLIKILNEWILKYILQICYGSRDIWNHKKKISAYFLFN